MAMKTRPTRLLLGSLALGLLAVAAYWFLVPRDKEVAAVLIEMAPAQRLLG